MESIDTEARALRPSKSMMAAGWRVIGCVDVCACLRLLRDLKSSGGRYNVVLRCMHSRDTTPPSVSLHHSPEGAPEGTEGRAMMLVIKGTPLTPASFTHLSHSVVRDATDAHLSHSVVNAAVPDLRASAMDLAPSGPILLPPRSRLPSVARTCLAMHVSSPHQRCCARLRAVLDGLTRWAG